MTKRLPIIPIGLLAICLAGCATLWTGTVTITRVVDESMKCWAEMSVAGKTTAQFDKQVMETHEKYRLAAGVAYTALRNYEAGLGSRPEFLSALRAAKDAAGPLVNLISSLLEPQKAESLKTELAKAEKP